LDFSIFVYDFFVYLMHRKKCHGYVKNGKKIKKIVEIFSKSGKIDKMLTMLQTCYYVYDVTIS